MPIIDANTAVLFATGSVIIALVLCTALRRHKMRDAGIRWLTASNCAFLFAAIGVLLSGIFGFAASAVLVVAGAYTGICCGWFAVLATEQKPVPWLIVLAAGALAVAMQGLLAVHGESVTLLMLSSSAVNSVLLGFIIWRVWVQVRPHSPRLASLNCMPFALLFAGYVVRIPTILLWPGEQGPLLTTLFIVVAMAWASVILNLAMVALREAGIQAQLRSALAKAEAAQHARTRFLLGISHDLRTPLNAILGLSELMRNEVLGCLPKGYLEQANHIHDRGVELNELVSDLLMHTSVESDQTECSTDTVIDLDMAVRDKFLIADSASQGFADQEATGT